MREEVLFSAGAQYMDASGYKFSELEHVEFLWENTLLEMDAVFRPVSEMLWHLEREELIENLILLDVEEDKKSSPPTTPVSERPNQPLALLPRQLSGARIENVPVYVYRTLFQ